jgi:hypothetical protein
MGELRPHAPRGTGDRVDALSLVVRLSARFNHGWIHGI